MCKVIRVFLILLVVISLNVAYAEAPFNPQRIINDLYTYASRVIPGKCVKAELAAKDRYTNVEIDYRIYPYYCSMVVVEWEGSYGQIYRDNIYINYLKVKGEWLFDIIFKDDKEQSVLIKEPTKPLPTPPAAPDKDTIIKLFDNWIPIYGTDDHFEVEVLSVSEPTFRWEGLDYEKAVYAYTGRLRWTSTRQGEGFFGALFPSKEVWEANYTADMIYTFADQEWEHKIRRSDEEQIK